jgi:hypothetical protein
MIAVSERAGCVWPTCPFLDAHGKGIDHIGTFGL